jgi:hypothetical protein
MSPFHHQFVTYHSIEPHAICAADKCMFYAIRTGDLWINVPCGESLTPILLKDALHAPDIGLTIISIGHIVKAGCDVTFGSNNCTIKNNTGRIIGIVPANAKGLYHIDHNNNVGTAIKVVPLSILHQ